MKNSIIPLLILFLLIPSTHFAQDLGGLGELDDGGDLEMEITGKVVDVKVDSLRVKPEGQWRPKVGDPVRIVIGSGVVREVTEDGVIVDLKNGGAAVNMVASIRSPNAELGSGSAMVETHLTPATPPVTPSAPPAPPKPQAPEPPKWASLSAEENYNMGAKYYQGDKVAQDYGKALDWFQHAADKGHVGALNDIGVMYELGQGVSKNPAKAVEYYQKAVAKNYALGHYNLGRAYETGNGIGKNYSEALKSFRRAARMGEKNAQNKLSSRGQRW
ncbi:MAG: sel1 repeat family protein [Candidatus Nitronauta litoralis]|uniref:Sel1 repeat family protein n=1 Tax=Candidatus Nitronauta litoralis TaxID=2705533 RepID=A0A7T0BTV6_9BACT|nr:MAG: sel1 repeat family protein [Candidatus Nitronauta litoralis]